MKVSLLSREGELKHYSLEFSGSIRILRLLVGVTGKSQSPVGLLDDLDGSIALNFENCVVVVGHKSRSHRERTVSPWREG